MIIQLFAAAAVFAAVAQDATTTSTAAGVAQPASSATDFSVDPVHSTALFRVTHFGAGPFWGRFNDVTGTITYDPSDPSALAFDVEIAIESIDTGATDLDNHLRTADFFDAENHPTMTFRGSDARSLGENRYELEGEITIRGITLPLTVEVEHTGTANMGRGNRCGMEATFTLDRGNFEVNYGYERGFVGREVRIIVAMEGVAAQTGGPRRGSGEMLANRLLELDENGDGQITEDEMPENFRRILNRVDEDGDGVISAREIEALRGGDDDGV